MTSHIMTLPRVRGSGQLILSLLWMVSERHQFVASQPPIKLTKRKRKVYSPSMLAHDFVPVLNFGSLGFCIRHPWPSRSNNGTYREAWSPWRGLHTSDHWLMLLHHGTKSKGNASFVAIFCPSSPLAEMHRRARALAFRPATIFAFNVFLISHEVTGVLGDYNCIIGRLCEH